MTKNRHCGTGHVIVRRADREKTNITLTTHALFVHGCGGQHAWRNCKFLEAECYKCGKKGHIAKVCRSEKQPTKQVAATEQPAEQVTAIQRLNRLNQVNAIKLQRVFITVDIEGRNLKMELDSGAPCGIISIKSLREIKPHFVLQPTDRQFKSYTHHHLKCVGRISVNATLGQTTKKLNLYVVKENMTLFLV